MRKNLIAPIPQTTPAPDESWLDFDEAALLEVTSEDKEYPVGSVLVLGEHRAGVPPVLVPNHPPNFRSAAKPQTHLARPRESKN